MNDFISARLIQEKQVIADLAVLDVASEEIEKYGVHPEQFIEWYGPADGQVIVIVHGDQFNTSERLSYLRPAAFALGEAGYRAALIEYRQIAGTPEVSVADIATLAQYLEPQHPIWIGHSFGTVLVLGALFDPANSVRRAIVLSEIFDLQATVESQSPAGQSIAAWLGGLPQDIPEIYAKYDPALLYARLGGNDGFASHEYRLDIIHGAEDETVSVQHTNELKKEIFNTAIVPKANHDDLICPGHEAWLFLNGALS